MLELTDRERFLMSIQAYLINGGMVYSEDIQSTKRSAYKVESIMNDFDSFLEIDILKDELTYHCLELDDFKWTKTKEKF